MDKSHHLYSRFATEAHILKSLNYPSIPIIYDIEEDDEYFYIIEEYIQGVSLASIINNHKSLPISTIYEYAKQICETLLYMHQLKPIGILHLDLKPDNIIITDGKIKLIDYGNAIVSKTKVDECIGSKGFAAPEQYESGVLTPAADIYSVGAVLLYMATGTFAKENIYNVSSGVLQNIIDKCMKHNPQERYENISSLLNELEKIKITADLSQFINFVGTKSGIGVTHAGLMFCSYLARKGYKCIYQEMNSKRDVIKMINAADNVKFKKGVYKIENCSIMPYSDNVISEEWMGKYDFIVRDYGWCKDFSVPVYDGMTVVVGGGKDYELDDTIEAYKQILSNNKGIALINFTQAGRFVRKFFEKKLQSFYRLNYVADPFSKSKEADVVFGIITKKYLEKERFYEKKGRNKNNRRDGNSG